MGWKQWSAVAVVIGGGSLGAVLLVVTLANQFGGRIQVWWTSLRLFERRSGT